MGKIVTQRKRKTLLEIVKGVLEINLLRFFDLPHLINFFTGNIKVDIKKTRKK